METSQSASAFVVSRFSRHEKFIDATLRSPSVFGAVEWSSAAFVSDVLWPFADEDRLTSALGSLATSTCPHCPDLGRRAPNALCRCPRCGGSAAGVME